MERPENRFDRLRDENAPISHRDALRRDTLLYYGTLYVSEHSQQTHASRTPTHTSVTSMREQCVRNRKSAFSTRAAATRAPARTESITHAPSSMRKPKVRQEWPGGSAVVAHESPATRPHQAVTVVHAGTRARAGQGAAHAQRAVERTWSYAARKAAWAGRPGDRSEVPPEELEVCVAR